MNEKHAAQIGWVLFWTFWLIYTFTALGTIGMLFFGFGKVLPDERSTLINAFLVESAVGICGLFYSVFKLRRPNGARTEINQGDLEEKIKTLVAEIDSANDAINTYREENMKLQLHNNKLQYIAKVNTNLNQRNEEIANKLAEITSLKYEILGLLANRSTVGFDEIYRELNRERKTDRNDILAVLGGLKEEGKITRNKYSVSGYSLAEESDSI